MQREGLAGRFGDVDRCEVMAPPIRPPCCLLGYARRCEDGMSRAGASRWCKSAYPTEDGICWCGISL